MHKGFPVRINRRDVDKHFHNMGFQKKPDSDIKVFRHGARHYLHPSLSVLDRVDCELIYYKSKKIIIVSYDSNVENVDNTDYTRKKYAKCVMSGDVGFIVDIINEYIDDKRKLHDEYNSPINSNVQPEPFEITTMEGTPE